MASFFTLHGDCGVSLRIDWSPYTSGSCYCLTSRGNLDLETPRSLRYLKDEVAAGWAAWDGPIKIPGTFGHTPCYWEWAEDVLSRCSSVLSMAHLEKKLGGLPIEGQIFDEVVPSAECLSRALPNKDRIPESCPFFLQAYHRLPLSSADDLVLITDWINSWSESPCRYVGPLLLVFEQLGVCVGIAKESYCVAFLSCWLCLFVFPLEPYGYIRGSVFKMASCMATRIVVSLAILVPANIYKGLSVVASSTSPSTSPCCFPAHYLFGWMGTYLHTHSGITLDGSRACDSVAEARGRLDKCHLGWTALKPRWPTSFVLSNHKPQSYEDITFFFSLRIRNEIRATVDVMAGLRLWRICTIVLVGQRVRFTAFKDSSPCIPGRGKGLLVHPSLVLKRKASSVNIWEDKDHKHTRGFLLKGSGSTHVASHEMSPRLPSDHPVEVSSSLSGGLCTEVVDTGESHAETDEVIPPSMEVALILQDGTGPGIASVGEYHTCMATEILDATVTSAAAPSSVQHIEYIFMDNLRVAWVELCSLVEGKSHEALLA
ncbi:hypothetical protein LIER_24538 [Lithospermum erythrorhizon]|uniref:Aminotransferase-like plant mobile domain-containing protein n=1 Tax=Lithospermum erythrorhizon TaxID=34254 RepID=A0AAV3R1N2_LITER